MVNCSPSVAVISVDLSAVFLSRDKSAVEISFLSYPLPPYEAACVTRCIVVPLIIEGIISTVEEFDFLFLRSALVDVDSLVPCLLVVAETEILVIGSSVCQNGYKVGVFRKAVCMETVIIQQFTDRHPFLCNIFAKIGFFCDYLFRFTFLLFRD